MSNKITTITTANIANTANTVIGTNETIFDDSYRLHTLHIIEPWWNNSKMEQTVGRVNRHQYQNKK